MAALLGVFAVAGCGKEKPKTKKTDPEKVEEDGKQKPSEVATAGDEDLKTLFAEASLPGKRKAAAVGDAPFLKLIPADSPVVFASHRRFPRQAIDKWAELGGAFADIMRKELQQKIDSGEIPADDVPAAKEFLGALSREGLERLGFSLEPHFALYMIGASLAFRLELADGNKLRDMIKRMPEPKEGKVVEKKLGEVSYWEISEDEVTIAISIAQRELVVGIMPRAAADSVLAILLGSKPPSESLASSGKLKSVIGKYGLQGYATGYLDIAGIAEIVTGGGSPLMKSTLAAAGAELPPMSDVCRQELREMAAVAPRLIFGYAELSNRRAVGLSVLEMRSDIARGLGKLPSELPDLNELTNGRPLFSVGLGIDLQKGLGFIADAGKRILARPYQCEHFAPLNAAAAKLAEPPPVFAQTGNVLGGGLVAYELKPKPNPSGKGYAVLAVPDPMKLIGFLGGISGKQLEFDKLEADGKPITIPVPNLDRVEMAVKNKWIGVSVGGSEKMLRLMNQPSKSGGPALLVSYDPARFIEFAKLADPDDPPPPGTEEFLQAFFKGYSHTGLYFTNDGVVVKSVTQFD